MVNWKVKQAHLTTWFYLCTPCVPGGVARIMITDDFGNLVQISLESAGVSVS